MKFADFMCESAFAWYKDTDKVGVIQELVGSLVLQSGQRRRP